MSETQAEERIDNKARAEAEAKDNQTGILWDKKGRRWSCLYASGNKGWSSKDLQEESKDRVWVSAKSGLELMGSLFMACGATSHWMKNDRYRKCFVQPTDSTPLSCCRLCDQAVSLLCPEPLATSDPNSALKKPKLEWQELSSELVQSASSNIESLTTFSPSVLDPLLVLYEYSFCSKGHPHNRLCMEFEIATRFACFRVFYALDSPRRTKWIGYYEMLTPNKESKKRDEDPFSSMNCCDLCDFSRCIDQKLSTLSDKLVQRMVRPIGVTGTINITPHFRESDLPILSR